MNAKTKGAICGIIAAISYGTNPLGALPLYELGANPDSVLFYRYAIAALVLAAITVCRRESLRVSRRELGILALLGVLCASSSLSLFMSFLYMDAGIASTMLFVYPVMVAVIMAVCFREKVSAVTVASILLSLSGIALLYRGGDGASLSLFGVMLVMISSLTYAVYIVVVNRAVLNMSSVKLTMYVMMFGVVTLIAHSMIDPNGHLQLFATPSMWGYALLLALLPTVLSFIMMTISVHNIGSTPTAVLGALEPITAVVIGVSVFGEAFTARLALGILLVLVAVILVVWRKR